MTTAILQARMGSTRLPGKMLLPIHEGRGALELMLERLRRARSLSRLVVATTTLPEDDVLEALCRRLQVPCFRGDAADVLDRYYRCAQAFDARGTLVRLTGDCPLHDPEVVDRVVAFFEGGDYDYAANTHPPTFPDGLDTEVFRFTALEQAWRRAQLSSEREHVTYHLYTHPETFRIGNLSHGEDLSALRWTLDEARDLDFIRRIYERLAGRGGFGMNEVVALVRREPELLAINHDIERDAGLRKSLELDRLRGNAE